LGQFFRFGKN